MSDQTLTIPTHSVRQRWNLRKVEETWKRRHAGESTVEIANELGCSPDALRQAWRQLGYFLQEPRLDLEPHSDVLRLYRLGHSLMGLCKDRNLDYARFYAAMKWRGLLTQRGNRWSDAEAERLMHLDSEGWTHEEIGKELNRSENSVRNMISRMHKRGDRRIKWPDTRIRRAKRLLASGKSRTEVAIILGCSTAALTNALLRRKSLPQKRTWTDEQLLELRQRLNDGESLDDIAFEYGIQANSLYCLLRRRGV